ncbi:MAG: hypothetical protein V1698_01125 [bacterium]
MQKQENLEEISLKSTKAELFNAYEKIRSKFEEVQKGRLPLNQEVEIKKEEEKILERTAGFSPDSLENEIDALKKKIVANFSETQNQMIAESGKLNDLREAIGIEAKRLEEIYNIKLSADVLQVLIADFDAKKKEIEAQKIKNEAELQEEASQKRKEWQREQEEYKYNLKIDRKKEQDEYNLVQAKIRSKEQDDIENRKAEIAKREDDLAKQKEEVEIMRKNVEEFPRKLEEAVNEAKEKIAKILQKDFDTERQIIEQKRKSKEEIFEAKAESQQEIIKSQANEILALKKSLAESSQRAQDLATVIVENASGIKQQIKLAEISQKEKKDKES